MQFTLNIKNFPDAVWAGENKKFIHNPYNNQELVVDIWSHSDFFRYWFDIPFDIAFVYRLNGTIITTNGFKNCKAYKDLAEVLLSL